MSVRPTLFALPGLGLDGRAFDALAAALADVADVVALDLPDATGTSLEAMTTSVVRRIREHGASRWLLLGHSRGGKIASLVASRTMTGRSGLFGLAGVVLLAGSPLSPEPMAQERREQMLAWVADGPLDEEQAGTFVEQNVGAPLPAEVDAEVRAELRRSSPDGWRDWLEHGSREDRTGEAALSAVPALLIAGGADGDLGADAQRRLNGAHYARARLHT
ncbi:alpha/beta fold hydrolase, partial [Rathayibacter tanaceti]